MPGKSVDPRLAKRNPMLPVGESYSKGEISVLPSTDPIVCNFRRGGEESIRTSEIPGVVSYYVSYAKERKSRQIISTPFIGNYFLVS